MKTEADQTLAGIVEIDEMDAGAPPRNRAKPSRDHDDSEPSANPQGRVSREWPVWENGEGRLLSYAFLTA